LDAFALRLESELARERRLLAKARGVVWNPANRRAPLVLYGAGKFSPKKGCKAPQNLAIIRDFFAHRYICISTSEHRSSSVCPRCLGPIRKIPNPGNNRHRASRYHECKGECHMTYRDADGNAKSVAFRFSRDVGAAVTFFTCFLHCVFSDNRERPEQLWTIKQLEEIGKRRASTGRIMKIARPGETKRRARRGKRGGGKSKGKGQRTDPDPEFIPTGSARQSPAAAAAVVAEEQQPVLTRSSRRRSGSSSDNNRQGPKRARKSDKTDSGAAAGSKRAYSESPPPQVSSPPAPSDARRGRSSKRITVEPSSCATPSSSAPSTIPAISSSLPPRRSTRATRPPNVATAPPAPTPARRARGGEKQVDKP
jgi:hypothetical protein